MNAAVWWTKADAAELAALVAELVRGHGRHRELCPTCRALAEPCADRAAIARERDAYEYAPLSAPAGFFADVGRRLAEHEAACRTCRLAWPARCAALGEAVEALIEWRWMRGLLSRAAYLRQQQTTKEAA
jgi:hypothetical protein